MEPTPTTLSVKTLTGLAVALFGVPVLLYVFVLLAPEGPFSSVFVTVRELSVLALTALLILYVLRVEKLGLDSIGLHNRNWGKSLLLALIILLASFAVLALLLFLFPLVGISFGESGEVSRYGGVSPWAITLMVLRAGVVEEICYRGYAMERLEKATGNWFVYFLMPLILFGLWHYRQGVGGIIISFSIGAVLAYAYWKKRDLKANIIAHFTADFIPNVLAPLFVVN